MIQPERMAYAAVVMPGCAPRVWRVRSEFKERCHETGAPLYWSNELGWVDRESADTFDEHERMTRCLCSGAVWEGGAK